MASGGEGIKESDEATERRRGRVGSPGVALSRSRSVSSPFVAASLRRLLYHPPVPHDVVEAAYAFLRGHTRGDLQFEDHARPIRFVIGPDGRVATSVMYAMLEAVDTVLFVPREGDGAMEMGVTLLRLDERGGDGAMTDRWRIYHGDPQDIHWAFLEIDAARYEGSVIDGPALVRANPLADDESRLCRMINQEHRQDLEPLCRRVADVEIENPVMVGIDPLGIDVRGPFDVVRVPSTEPMPTAADAERVLEGMISDSERSD